MIVRELMTLLGFKLNDAPLKQYDKQIDAAKEKSGGLSNVIQGIGTASKWAALAAGAGFAVLGKSIIDATVQADRYGASLGILMGNQEKANALVNEVSNLAVGNIYGDEAVDTIQRLGDIANGSGVALSSLGLNMGQVFAKGKADATDLKQFVLQGFDVIGTVSAQTGKSRAEIEKSGVSYEQTAEALKQLTSEGGKYYGMMDKISGTLGGLIGQLGALKDSITMNIGLNINDKLKDILRHILRVGRAVQDELVGLGTRAFEGILRGIAEVIIFFTVLKMRMEGFGGAFTPLKALFGDVFGFLQSVLESATPFLLNLARLILVAFKPIREFVSPVLEGLKPVIADVFQFGADRIEKLIPLVDKLTPVFKQLGNTVSSIMATAWNTIKPFIDKVGEKADGLIDKITPYIEGLTPLIKSIGDTLEGSVAWALGLIEPVLTKALDVIDPLFKILEALGEVFFDIGETLWNAIQPVFDALGMNAESSQKGMMNFLDVVIKGLEIAAAIVKTMGKILNWIVGIVAGLLVPAIVAFIDAGRLIRSVIVSVITFLGKVLLGIVSGVQKVIEAFTGLGGALSNAWTVFKNGLARIPEALSKAWETVKAGFGAFGKGAAQALKTAGRGFAALGAPIKKFADGMGQFFTGFVDTLKSLWSGLTDFFSGLWEGIKNSPLEAVAFIKDAFLGLFDSIKERFFGFINTIKEGWEKVKGFLGGIGEGVANFFTGGGADKAGTPGGQSSAGASAGAGVTAGRQTGGLQPQKVNDLIVTPEGQYSTHPDDYIMAMKDPASVIDALVRFLGQGAAAQPAYTGAAAGGSPIETAFNGAATRQNTYNNATSSVSAPINVNVNTVGMTAEQAKNAIRRGVNDALSEAIHTSRRAIPKPEAGGL